MSKTEISRREFLEKALMAATATIVTLSGCRPEESRDVVDPLTEEEGSTSTLEILPTVTATTAATATEISSPDGDLRPTLTPEPTEILWNVETLREHLEGMSFRASSTEIEVTRMEYDGYAGEWKETTGKEPAWWYGPEVAAFDNVQFNVVKVESEYVVIDGVGSYVFSGYIPNMTGDSSRWKVEIGRLRPDLNEFEFLAKPAYGDGSEHYDGIEVSYGAWARKSWYPNKIYNILKALNDFRYNTIEGFGDGEVFSFIQAIALEEHLKDPEYYLRGYNTQGREVDAGGVCGACSPTGKAGYLLERLGLVEVRNTPHSRGPYYVNLEDTDTIDATAEVVYEGKNIDLEIENVSGRRLYFIPKVDVIMKEDFPEGYKLRNSMWRPSEYDQQGYDESITLVLSITITDRPPTLEESKSVEEALERVVARQAKYGYGLKNGFNTSKNQ